jgi:hypothetical protein
MKPLQVQGAQMGLRKDQIDIQQAPLDSRNKQLSGQKTAQDIQIDRFKTGIDLKKQFDADERVKVYKGVIPKVAGAMSAPDSAQGDISVVYAFAQVMDPASAVRGEEMDMARGSSPIVDQALSLVGMVKEGKRLPPETRRGLIDAIRSRATQYEGAYAEAREEFQGIAQQGGYDPDQVIGKHAGARFNDIERQFAGQTKSASPQEFDRLLSDMLEQGKPVKEIRDTLKQYGSTLPPWQEKILDQYEAARVQGQPTQVGVRTLPGKSVGTGLALGAKQALDRAAIGAESLFNAIPGLPNSNSAAAAAAPGLEFADPTATTVGRLAGSTLLSAPLANPLLAGAAGNLMMTDSTGGEAFKDAAVGAAGGFVGDRVVRGVAGMFAPQGREAMTRLNQQGVQFSPGQMIGGRARALEDRMTANPILGPRIDAIREQGLEAANRILPNRALGAIGQQLPDNVPAGHAAVDYTRTQLGNAYDNALNGQQIGLDPTYVTRLNAIGAGARLRPQELNELGEIVQREIGGAFQETGTPLGSMSGRGFKEIDERIGDMVSGFNASDDPYRRQLGSALADVRDQTRALARRQNPQMGQGLRAADEGYSDFSILRRAAQSNPATGIFTPGQLRTAVRANDRSVGKGATARGAARAQDLASDMSETMPSTVGSSGTSEREQVNKLAPWVMGSLMSPLYSDMSQQALAHLLLRQPGPNAQRVANMMRSLPRGMFGGGAPLLIESGAGY